MATISFFPLPSPPPAPQHHLLSPSPSLRRSPTTAICACAKPPPARDRVIDFGKHKGKKLGTLPSSYLAWVSDNLRARDFRHWAELADQVLVDPFYKDRIEWEHAERLLSGDVSMSSLSPSSAGVDALLEEVSQRFGWDNEDKIGWSKVDFALLGTTHGGRIPRVCDSKVTVGSNGINREGSGHSVENGMRGGGRERRRQRVRKQREREAQSEPAAGDKLRFRGMCRGRTGNVPTENVGRRFEKEQGTRPSLKDPDPLFPGREKLVKTVLAVKLYKVSS